MTPQELLNQIHADRQALASLWLGLTEEKLVRRPGTQVDWPVQDLIAHIAWWETFIVKRVTGLVSGEQSEPAEHHDLLNTRAYEQFKDRSLAEVLEAFHASRFELEALVSSLTEEQINTPAYYRTYDGVALLPILGAGTFNHYPAHRLDLGVYVERLKTSCSGS